ncbi:MAG: ABC transporter ATP-binding protein [Deltaproteobacteria bacterium 13_1_40CM_68_24]|nr:MAG: ABC transporter ATP-binding protein [Deltaproteobacteria bacterium 13_1_40CM_68_24]
MDLLSTRKLDAYYGDSQVLFGVDFEIERGEIAALVGANGAGKSTLLKTVCGLRRGIALVPEGRRLFPSLSAEENLMMGGYVKRAGPWKLDSVYRLFPRLQQRRAHPAASLSGGEQQMVAIGRALMSNPQLLICDELSLGLAPVVVKEIYQALEQVCRDGVTAVIVEQDVAVAQRVSRRLYCMQEGRITLHGLSSELTRERISRAYFGV